MFQDRSPDQVGDQGLEQWLKGREEAPEAASLREYNGSRNTSRGSGKQGFSWVSHKTESLAWPPPYLLPEIVEPGQSGHLSDKCRFGQAEVVALDRLLMGLGNVTLGLS